MGFQSRLDDVEVPREIFQVSRDASGHGKLFTIQLLRLGHRIEDVTIFEGSKASEILCGLLFEGVIPKIDGEEIKKDYILKNGDRIYLSAKVFRC